MAATKKGGLGRGLGSLFGESGLPENAVSIINPEEAKKAAPAKKENNGNSAKPAKTSEKVAEKVAETKASDSNAETVQYLKITDIKPNSAQPRKLFNEELLEELASSIKEHGVIQPIIVRKAGKGYELVAGERRWRAARKAGLKEIPALVRVLDERQNAFLALIENMQREDLNIVEEAEGIQEIIEKYELTQDEAAKVIGKSRSYVTNALRINKLPEEVLAFVNSGKLSAGHARAIAGLPTENLQIEAAKKAAEEGWSVRQIESYTGEKSLHKKAPRKKSYSKDIEIRNIEEQISERIGTKVIINGSEKKGRVEIQYYSKAELNSIVSFLLDK